MFGDLLPAPGAAAAFALAVLVINASPGPDMLLTIARSLQHGARAGLAAMAGVNAGCVLHALAAAFGVAAVLALWPPLFTLLQWGGAAYLAWLGAGLLWRACRSTPTRAGGDGRTQAAADPAAPMAAALAAPGLWTHFRAGLWTNVLNPKVLLFFLAFVPPFVPAASPSRSASFLLLGGWFVLQNTLLMSVIAVLAAQLRRWQTPAAVRRVAAALGGTLFVWLAWRLVTTRGPAA